MSEKGFELPPSIFNGEIYPKSKTLLTVSLAGIMGALGDTLVRTPVRFLAGEADLGNVLAPVACAVGTFVGGALSYKISDWCCIRCCPRDPNALRKTMLTATFVAGSMTLLVPVVLYYFNEPLDQSITETSQKCDDSTRCYTVLTSAVNFGTKLLGGYAIGVVSYSVNYRPKPNWFNKFCSFFRCDSCRVGVDEEIRHRVLDSDDELSYEKDGDDPNPRVKALTDDDDDGLLREPEQTEGNTL